MHRVHRVAWALFRGPIPKGMCVLHYCDNRPCCNPDHLYLGTNANNTADMLARGRESRGERSGQAKLTETQARDILEKHTLGLMVRKELA